jgi:hypothetical protein
MGALLYDAPTIHHGDEVGIPDCGETMGYNNDGHGAFCDETVDRLLNLRSNALCDAALALYGAALILCNT